MQLEQFELQALGNLENISELTIIIQTNKKFEVGDFVLTLFW